MYIYQLLTYQLLTYQLLINMAICWFTTKLANPYYLDESMDCTIKQWNNHRNINVKQLIDFDELD
jgi:hypothetical protein